MSDQQWTPGQPTPSGPPAESKPPHDFVPGQDADTTNLSRPISPHDRFTQNQNDTTNLVRPASALDRFAYNQHDTTSPSHPVSPADTMPRDTDDATKLSHPNQSLSRFYTDAGEATNLVTSGMDDDRTSLASPRPVASGSVGRYSQESTSFPSTPGSLANSLGASHGRSLGLGPMGAGPANALIEPDSLAASEYSSTPRWAQAPLPIPGGQPASGVKPYDGNMFEPPKDEVQLSTSHFSAKRFITILGIAAVFALVIGFIYLQVLRKPTVDPTTVVSASGTNTATLETLTGQEAVQNYLDALARGDVKKALSYGEIGPGQQDAITPDGYSRALKDAPLTDIKVDPMRDGATNVHASYKIGNHQIAADYPLIRTDTGGWRLAKTTVTFHFVMPNADNVPLLVNGIEVDKNNPIELLPGQYTISTGLPFIGFADDPIHVVGSLDYPEINDFQLTTVLTPAGTEALQDAAANSLAQCISSAEAAPKHCPIAMKSAKPIRPETARWKLVNNPWEDVVPAPRPSDQSIGEISVTIETTFSADYADGTSAGTTSATFSATAFASMIVHNPEDLQITWQ